MKPYQEVNDNQAAIDLTPMLDVVFIMLIFFIVTATFIKETTLSFNRPDKSTTPPSHQETKNILVKVHPDNQIKINNLQIDKRALRAYFQQHQAKNPKAIVIIKAHNKSNTATLITIADAANQAGMKGISLDNIDKI